MGVQVPGKSPYWYPHNNVHNLLSHKAVTVYTFLVLVLFRRPGEYTSIIVIVAIWICTGLIVGVPLIVHKPEIFYGDTDFCMILSSVHWARLTVLQGVGFMQTTSSSAYWPTMFGLGWLGLPWLSCTPSSPSQFVVWPAAVLMRPRIQQWQKSSYCTFHISWGYLTYSLMA